MAGNRGRAATLSNIIQRGRHKIEFLIKKMTGTIFVGLFSAKLIVSWQRGEKVKQLRMRSLDDNWYFSKDNGGFPVWYLSDIGVYVYMPACIYINIFHV